MVEHLRELKGLGAPETVINALVQELIDQFPHLARAIDPGIANIDKAGAIIGELGRITSNSIDLLKSGSNLVPGEMPPHILAYLLNEGVNITQIHDPSLHGDLPPHVRHFESQYHEQFRGVISLKDLAGETFKTLIVHVYQDNNGSTLVPVLALLCERIWHEALIAAVISDHLAPHHVAIMRHPINQILFWE